jgi:hypothetical protein
MVKRLLIIILAFLWASSAFAETLWVRPASSGCANNGDGSAYGCAASPGAPGAWIGWDNIVWGSGENELNHGDTLKFCDLWDYNEGDFDYLELSMTGGGGSEGNILTVDFGDETYPGAILGSLYKEGSECVDNEDGTFTFPSGYNGGIGLAAYGDDYTTAVPLQPSESAPPADGYFYYDPVTYYITINPPGAVAFESLERTYFKCRGSFNTDGYDYITLNEPKIYFSSSSYPSIELSDRGGGSGRVSEHIIITGGTFRYTGSEFINAYSGSSNYVEISYCDFKYFQQVTYPNYAGGLYHNNWHVHHNYVDGDTQEYRTGKTDAHLFGGQNISYGLWEYNTLVNVYGDGFLIYVGAASSAAKDNIMRYNLIIFTDAATEFYRRAFDIGGTNDNTSSEITSGNFFHNNIIIGAGVGVRLKYGYDHIADEYNKAWNNTFINCDRVVELINPNHDDVTTCGNGIDFQGNIVLGSVDDHFYSDNHTDAYFSVISDYNIWYPDTSEGAPLWTIDGTACDDFADWKTEFFTQFGYNGDEHSYCADPLLVGAGTYDEADDVKFPTNSLAKDNGADLTPTDYFGTSRPQGERDDVGAFEFYAGESPEEIYTKGVGFDGVGKN